MNLNLLTPANLFWKCAVLGYFILLNLVVVKAQLPPCGATLTNDTRDMLESPLYPYPMEPHQICNWNFSITGHDVIYVRIVDLELADEDLFVVVDGDQREVFNGSNVSVADIFVLSAVGSSLSFTIASNQSSSPRRFLAYYTTAAPTYFITDHHGMIKSPHYFAKSKVVDISVSWIITQEPDSSIYLAFLSFNITEGNLLIDYGEESFNFSGTAIPNDLPLPGRNVNISLTMTVPNSQGFKLQHALGHPDCSKTVTIDNSTHVNVTFNEPEADRLLKCFVIVEGPKDSVLMVALLPDLSEEYNESNTMLIVRDGGSRYSPSLLVYSPPTSLEAPDQVVTSGNRVWISYSSVPLKKPLTITATVVVQNSGKTIHGSKSFTLPKRENATLVSDTSVYILSVESNHQVVATISSPTILNKRNSLLFYDGANYHKLLANVTANSTFYPIVGTKSQMLVEARDFEGNDTFTASFSGFPKGTNLLSTDSVGSYQLTSVSPNSTYFWVIKPLAVNSSDILAVTFNSLNLNNQSSVTIYDGAGENTKIIYKVANSSRSFVLHGSAERGVRVVLENTGNGYVGVIIDASYELQNACKVDLNLTNTTQTTITSPGYPYTYPINANCTWSITANKRTLITFKELNVPASQPVLIYSTKDPEIVVLLANVSGNATTDDLNTDEKPIVIIFAPVTSLATAPMALTGFRIDILTVDCGGMLNQSKGEFRTPSYPHAETLAMLCVWSITVPAQEGGNVNIVSMSYSSGAPKSNSAQLMIYEGGSLQSPPANMSAINQSDFLSRTNKIIVKYENVKDSGISYSFNYGTYGCSKDQLCMNGICMHDSWKCNGINDCGDFSDERNCTDPVIIQTTSGGVSVTAFVIVMFVALFLGIGLAIGGPILWRKFRTSGSYQEFRNTADA